eukprot:2498177-Alexandrium_andersonii.AAC.1
MLARQEVGSKLVALTADGAGVMGTQRGGRPLAEPREGPVGNLAHSLLQFKREFSSESLMVIWCCPHRLDLVAEKLEDHSACGPLLSMVRRLCAHV